MKIHTILLILQLMLISTVQTPPHPAFPQFHPHSQFQKVAIPTNIKSPQQHLTQSVHQLLQNQCQVQVKELLTQYMHFCFLNGKFFFYMVYQTQIGLLSVYAVWEYSNNSGNVDIFKVNIFDDFDQSLQEFRVKQQDNGQGQTINSNKFDILPLFLKHEQQKQQGNTPTHLQLKNQCQNRISEVFCKQKKIQEDEQQSQSNSGQNKRNLREKCRKLRKNQNYNKIDKQKMEESINMYRRNNRNNIRSNGARSEGSSNANQNGRRSRRNKRRRRRRFLQKQAYQADNFNFQQGNDNNNKKLIQN